VAREAADRLVNRAPALPSIPLVDPPARPYHYIPLRSSRKRHGLLGLPARNQRHLHQDQWPELRPRDEGLRSGGPLLLPGQRRQERASARKRRREKQDRSAPENDDEPPAW